jgi:hypothetical protein
VEKLVGETVQQAEGERRHALKREEELQTAS